MHESTEDIFFRLVAENRTQGKHITLQSALSARHWLLNWTFSLSLIN